MSVVGEAKGVFDLLSSGWTWLRDRRDPVRLQARRLIDAFEAYGIARQQIARVLPPEFALPPAAFSTPDLLKDKLSAPLLDWTAEYLALNRPWLDGLDVHPHRHINDHFSDTAYADWFRERLALAREVNRRLCMWAPYDLCNGIDEPGTFSVVYIEDSAGLDDLELSRYWLLSESWPIDHRPCLTRMASMAEVATTMGISVIGRVVQQKVLDDLERGRLLAPRAGERIGRSWYPPDFRLDVRAD